MFTPLAIFVNVPSSVMVSIVAKEISIQVHWFSLTIQVHRISFFVKIDGQSEFCLTDWHEVNHRVIVVLTVFMNIPSPIMMSIIEEASIKVHWFCFFTQVDRFRLLKILRIAIDWYIFLCCSDMLMC